MTDDENFNITADNTEYSNTDSNLNEDELQDSEE